jgi:manganese/zinc/iron transport system permease protein
VVALNLVLVTALWKELKATTFDPDFGATVRLRPRLLSRLLLVAAAVTAVAAFDAVGAILVVTLLIVPAATAYLLTDRLVVMVVIAVGVGWIGAAAGYAIALPMDSSIAGAMGLVCAGCFALALLVSPRHGVLARRLRRARAARNPVAPPAG